MHVADLLFAIDNIITTTVVNKKKMSKLLCRIAKFNKTVNGHKLQARFKSMVNSVYVPDNEPATEKDINKLKEFLTRNNKVLVITGAGISTESGIPDYRSDRVGLYARRGTKKHIMYQDFVKSADIRQRFWARNFVGWPTFSSCLPNCSHKILSESEYSGKIHWLLTQNIDALHTKAGSTRATELHGCVHRVTCLNCDIKMPRTALQDLMQRLNPDWHAHSVEMAPHGDVQLSAEQIQSFQVPGCPNCNGILKPEIVFFGDNVPKTVVKFVLEKVNESDSVFVIGSSLEVYSGYRFVNLAHHQQKPIAILNIGPTRADQFAVVKVSAKCSDVLESVRQYF